ncbi:proline-rich protein 12-like [Pyrus ussuriensis x Pyrus communis]|uniref:Proline-rich protein 12-like n=1 Tax=Pyrus ussuriensis x Pyrus communis TaxID=2448454 RepID=A0A5N5GIR8_9ROSA|nr:proline-rich protein 12-like [Pyrus ussuriensis x Pyrus communis]
MASNTFIIKLSEECAKCIDFIDRNAIKTLRFEGDLIHSHQILGPLFKDCSATNTMVLLLGLVGPTMLDISAILSTYPYGLPVDVVFPRYQFNLDPKALFEERVCREVEQEFQERCTKLRLQPNVPETHSTNTIADWWGVYIQKFFGTSVKDAVKKVFGNHPKKALAIKSKEAAQVSCLTKEADMAATVIAKKKPTSPTNATTVRAPAASRTPMVVTTVPKTEVPPVVPAVVKPVVIPLVEGPVIPGPVVAPTIGPIALAEKNPSLNPKKKINNHRRRRGTTIFSMIETASRVNSLTVEAIVGHETIPTIEMEVTTEMPIHLQDQNLSIPPQEVTSPFVRTFIILLLNFLLLNSKPKNIKCQVPNYSVVYLSNVLEQTMQYFTTFERALRAEDDLKAAKITHEASRPEVKAIKAKKTQLTDLDHQIVEL